MSDDEIIGKLFINKQNLKFIVSNKSGKSPSGSQLFQVSFIESNYKKDASKQNILSGSIKDKLHPSICDIACMGYASLSYNRKEYNIWSDIVKRCHNTNHKDYKRYGGKGVKVCSRWLRFDYFLEDLPNIEGYNEKLFLNNRIQLDKDFKQIKKPYSERIYSKDTCIFIDAKTNVRYSKKTVSHFFAISPNGEIFEDDNLSRFSRRYGLDLGSSNKCLNGQRKTNKGWRFFKEKSDF